jgi:serine/threonine protein phosphatase PrpC/acyl dehydratase
MVKAEKRRVGAAAAQRICSAMRSHPGRIRRENQDCCAAAPELGIYAVADGMGGAAGGELASNLAVEAFLYSIGQSSQPSSHAHPRDRLEDAVSAANLAVFARAEKYRALRGMGTTVVAALIERTDDTYTAWLANVGDSRCYLLRDGVLQQLTTDHSLVEEQIEAGLLTREQAESSPVRNVITRAIGPQPAVAAEIAGHDLAPGDVLLLASDGLTKELTTEEIARLLMRDAGDLDASCEALVRAANVHGGRDNITVLLVACEEAVSPDAYTHKPEGESNRMSKDLYFDDFHVGQKFNSITSYTVTAAEIKDFGQKYDPQPFHLDEAAGEASFFHGLAASGWLTAAIVMRLRVQSLRVSGGMIGAGAEEMRWTEPVRPGDTLRTEIEVTGLRIARSRPQYGIVTTTTNCYNQDDKVVMRATVNFLAPLRSTVSK